MFNFISASRNWMHLTVGKIFDSESILPQPARKSLFDTFQFLRAPMNPLFIISLISVEFFSAYLCGL
jgi:hypothetical protein